MARRFVPVPYDAMDLVPEAAPLLDLYRRGHRWRWQAWESTTRSLATSWGVSTRRVGDILGVLEAAGFLRWVRGSNRKPSVITVLDPMAEDASEVNHRLTHKVKRRVKHNSEGSTDDITEPETQGDTQTETQGVPTLNDPDPDPDQKTMKEGEVSAKPTTLPLALTSPESQQPDEWQELAEIYGKLPNTRKPSKRDSPGGRNLQRMLTTLGRQDAESMLLWMAYAEGCPKAASLDEGGHRVLSTISRESHLEDYWTHVSRWIAGGRKGLPGPDGRPGGGPSSRKILNRPTRSTP